MPPRRTGRPSAAAAAAANASAAAAAASAAVDGPGGLERMDTDGPPTTTRGGGRRASTRRGAQDKGGLAGGAPPAAPPAPAAIPPATPFDRRPPIAELVAAMKRGRALFGTEGVGSARVPLDEDSQRVKIASKIRDEYAAARDFFRLPGETPVAGRAAAAAPVVTAAATSGRSTTLRLIEAVSAADAGRSAAAAAAAAAAGASTALALVPGGAGTAAPSTSARTAPAPPVGMPAPRPLVPSTTPGAPPVEYTPSAIAARSLPARWPRPTWHAPWRCYRVVAGHLGWVRSLAVDPGNDWFVSGSADRTIKVWDLATGNLRLTLTGHIEQVTGLAVSPRHPYLFSASLDKEVKCWDLETNRVIRNYHGHLSGVYSLALHPALDVLVTGGRDGTVRVWDMRTRVQCHALTGHTDTVASLVTQATDPQIISGSHDRTVRLWDIRKSPGKSLACLTYHKKAVRALAAHPAEYTFVGCSADAIKKYRLPSGTFLHNTLQHQRAIINAAAVNEDGVLVTGADDGGLWAWDWRSGNVFQKGATVPQPGSLDAEAGIFALAFDQTGSRLLSGEADKTIKFWKEDERASPESHPIEFTPPSGRERY